MAQNTQIGVVLNFKTNTQQAQQAITQLQQRLSRIATGTYSPNINSAQIQQASIAAQELQHHLMAAVNTDTGKLDLTRLSASLASSKTSLAQLSSQLLTCGKDGQQAFISLAQSVAQAEVSTFKLQGALGSLWVSFKNVAKYQLSSAFIMGFVQSISEAYSFAQDLNESLTNIRIVTGYSTEEMDKFAKKANSAAKALSTTTTAYTNASLIFYQQGLTDKEVLERTNVTIKMANVTGQAVEEVSDQLTAIWNNFDDGTKALEYYADVINALGAATASSTQEITEGLGKFAAIAETVGLSYEYATAALATVTAETRQSADVVGTAFKTLFARIQDLNLGETLEDGTTLGQYSQALAAVGINIKDINGQVKDMNVILDEMGAKWDTLTKAQQVALAQSVGGIRQYNQLIALMDNWSVFQENLNTVALSEGALQEQADIYAEGWEAARDRVTAALEDLYQDFLDDDFFIDILNFFADVLDAVDNFVESVGGIKPIITGIMGIIMTSLAHKVQPMIQNLVVSFQQLTHAGQQAAITKQMAPFVEQIKQVQQAQTHLTESEQMSLNNAQKMIELKQKLAFNSSKMSQDEKRTYEFQLSLMSQLDDAAVRQMQRIEEIASKRQSEKELLQQEIQLLSVAADKEAARALAAEQRQRSEQIGRNLKNTDYFTTQQQTTAAKLTGKQEEEAILRQQLDVAKGPKERLAIEKRISEVMTEQHVLQAKLESAERNLIILAQERQSLGIDTSGVTNMQELQQRMLSAQQNIQQNITASEQAYEQMATHAVEQYHRIAQAALESTEGTKAFTSGKMNVKASSIFGNLSTDAAKAKSQLQSIVQLLDQAGIKDDKLDFSQALASSNLTQQQVENINTALDTAEINVEQFRSLLKVLGQEGAVAQLDKHMTVYASKIDKSEKEVAELREQLQKLQQENEKLKQGANFGHKGGMIEGFTSMAGAATSLLFALQSLKGAVEAIGDEEMETGDKISTAIMAIAMALPMLISGAKGLAAAGAAVQLAWWQVALIIAAVAAVIAIAIAVFDGMKKAYNADAIAAKEANEALKTQVELVNELKSSYEALKTAIDDYTETQTKIEAMVAGTHEWNEAVYESNKAVTDLIGQYPMLVDYVDTVNGRLQLSQEGLNKLQQQQLELLQRAQNAQLTTQILANKADMRAQRTALSRTNKAHYSTETNLIFDGNKSEVLFAQAVKDLAEAYADSNAAFENFSDEINKLGDIDDRLKEALLKNENEIMNLIQEERALRIQNNLLEKEVTKNTLALLGENPEDPITEAKAAKISTIVKDTKNVYYQNAQTTIGSYDMDTLAQKYAEYLGEGVRIEAHEDGGFTILRSTSGGGWEPEGKEGSLTASTMREVLRDDMIRTQYYRENNQGIENEINAYKTQLKDLGIMKREDETLEDFDARLYQYIADYYTHGKLDLSNLTKREIDNLQPGQSTMGISAASFIQEYNKGYNSSLKIQNENFIKGYEEERANKVAKAYNALGLSGVDFNNYTKSLKGFGHAAEEAAESVVLITSGLKGIRETWDEDVEALMSGDIDNPAFVQAVGNVQEALTSWLGVDLGYDYVSTNLDTISLAMQGNEEAIKALSFTAAQQQLALQGWSEDVTNQVNGVITTLQQGEYVVGESAVNLGGQITNGLQKVVSSGDIALTTLNDIFTAAGWVLQYNDNTKQIDWANSIYVGFADAAKQAADDFDKANDKFEDELERYHEIKSLIEDLNNEIDGLENKKERAYGKARVQYLNKQLSKQKLLLAAEEEYKKKLADDLVLDRAQLDSRFELDADGRIINYTEQLKALQEQVNVSISEEQYEEIKEAADQYEETLKELNTQQEVVNDAINAMADMSLEKIEYEVEMNVHVNDREIKRLEHLLKQLDDPVNQAIDAIGLLGKTTSEEMQNIDSYFDGIGRILEGKIGKDGMKALESLSFEDITIDTISSILGDQQFTDAEIKDLEKYIDALYSSSEKIEQFYDNVINKVGEAFNKINANSDKTISRTQQLGTVLETYQNVIDLVGKKNLKLADEQIRALGRAQVEQAKTNLSIVQQQLEINQSALASAQEQLTIAENANDEQAVKHWAEQIEIIQENVWSLEEEVNAAWTETLQAAADDFANAVTTVMESFEDAMTGIYGSFSAMQEAYDQQSEISERHLADYTKIYELSKLNRELTKSIDENDSVTAKSRLRDLQEEINKLQASNTKMTQYEVDELRARYELRLAEIALEEAQNAKSQVRMQRDSEGNWSYVYTANQTATDKAAQDYEDKLYAYQELTQERTKELEDMLIGLPQEFAEAMKAIATDMTLSEEERKQRLSETTNYYTEKYKYLTQQLSISLEDANWLYKNDWASYNEKTGYKISLDQDWRKQFEDTTAAQILGYTDLDTVRGKFEQATLTMVNSITKAFKQWDDDVKDAFELVGEEFDKFSNPTGDGILDKKIRNVVSTLDLIKSQFTSYGSSAKAGFEDITRAAQQEIGNFTTKIDSYVSQINRVITQLTRMIELAGVELPPPSEPEEPDQSGTGGKDPAGNQNTAPKQYRGVYTDKNTNQVYYTKDTYSSVEAAQAGAQALAGNYFDESLEKARKNYVSNQGTYQDAVDVGTNRMTFWQNKYSSTTAVEDSQFIAPENGIELSDTNFQEETFLSVFSSIDKNGKQYQLETPIPIYPSQIQALKIKPGARGESAEFYIALQGRKNDLRLTPSDYDRLITDFKLTPTVIGYPGIGDNYEFNIPTDVANNREKYEEYTVPTYKIETERNGRYEFKVKTDEDSFGPLYPAVLNALGHKSNLKVTKVVLGTDGDVYARINATVGGNVSNAVDPEDVPDGGYADQIGRFEWVRIGDLALAAYDTGGYTGSWDSSGRLAMLHQKEVVLNAHDTENFLAAVNIVRDIASMIDLRAAAQTAALSALSAMSITPMTQTIDQNVTIHAEFPNATNHTEIEEAFTTLINRAAQFANRKN